MNIKVEILKCPHVIEKIYPCPQCEEVRRTLNFYRNAVIVKEDKRVPIYRGCRAASQGGCFCTGDCKEIIGYRDPIPGEIV